MFQIPILTRLKISFEKPKIAILKDSFQNLNYKNTSVWMQDLKIKLLRDSNLDAQLAHDFDILRKLQIYPYIVSTDRHDVRLSI